MIMQIRHRTALVTGAAKRVGRSIALRLAREGAHIQLHYHTSRQEAETTAAEIRSLGVSCKLLAADLSDPAEVQRLLDEVRSIGTPDIVVNSASLFYKTPLGQTDGQDWEKLLDTNLRAPFFISQALGRSMQEKRSGAIVNIADWSGFRPYRDYPAYCASKGGLITLTRALARDLAPDVRVNAVAPGPVLLPPDFTEAEKEAVTRQTAVGRIGTPEDVASAVAYLLDNDFVNGSVLVVDGGRSIV